MVLHSDDVPAPPPSGVAPDAAATPPPSGVDAGARATEDTLLQIVDAVREPLLVLDQEFRVTHANRAFLRTFRVDTDDTVGESLFALGNGEWDIPPLRSVLRDKDVAPVLLSDFELDRVFPHVGRKILLVNAQLVSRGANAERVVLLAFEDVTDQRVTDGRQTAQRRELQRSNTALDEFASVAAHDLQEPLRKIVSFGERLSAAAGDQLDANASHYLERMLHASVRMRTLINDLLAYSQVTTRVLPFGSTDLAGIAREVIGDLEAMIADAGGRVEVGPLPVIEADPMQMRQMLQNLLGNALKYRRKDEAPVVQLSATNGGNLCTITVSDNGIGFKQEHADKIFRMFERLHGRAEYDGSGIGLAICRKIAERHGGTIAATSSAGHGATFTVTLPVTQAATGQTS